jgi:hypothetical protein
LLFFYYLENYIKDIDENTYSYIKHIKYDKTKWLYIISGFNDKTVNTNNYYQMINSKIYNNYFKQLLDSVKLYNGKVTFYFDFDDSIISMKKYKILFFQHIDKEDNKNTPRHDPNYINREFIFKSIENKNIIIINNLATLMKQQCLNGNLNKIYDDTPIIKNIDYIEPSYTFLNNGPHDSILESVEYIYKDIDNKVANTDIFIISAGAYSILIANYIHTKYKKDIIVVGGDLSSFFGINTKRGYMFYKDVLETKKEYFINVPEAMKPDRYKEIEDGCYW